MADDPKKFGDINATFRNNNIVGDIGHKFYAPPSRHLSEADKAVLLARIPKGRKVKILFQASESDAGAFANEFHDFLVAHGYAVEGPHPGMLFPPPHGVSINLNEGQPEGEIQISVGIR